MTKRVFNRRSLRDAYAESNRADRFYAAMAGKPPQEQVAIAPKREIINRSPADDLEAAVMREVTTVLAGHKNVIFALRSNSGSMLDANGAPIWFYRWIKNSEDMTLTDFWGLARDGLFALEAKRRDWTYTGTQRERAQKAFIDTILRTGGRAGFVTCAEDAIRILG